MTTRILFWISGLFLVGIGIWSNFDASISKNKFVPVLNRSIKEIKLYIEELDGLELPAPVTQGPQKIVPPSIFFYSSTSSTTNISNTTVGVKENVTSSTDQLDLSTDGTEDQNLGSDAIRGMYSAAEHWNETIIPKQVELLDDGYSVKIPHSSCKRTNNVFLRKAGEFNREFWVNTFKSSFERIGKPRLQIEAWIREAFVNHTQARELLRQCITLSHQIVAVKLTRNVPDMSVGFPLPHNFVQFEQCGAGDPMRWLRHKSCGTPLRVVWEQNEKLYHYLAHHSLPIVDPSYHPKHFLDLGARDYSHIVEPVRWGKLSQVPWPHSSLRFFELYYPNVTNMTVDAFEVDQEYTTSHAPLNNKTIFRSFRSWAAAAWFHNDGIQTPRGSMMAPGDERCDPKKKDSCACLKSVNLLDVINEVLVEGNITMKIDIEGGEWVLLEHLIKARIIPLRIKEIFFECHNSRSGSIFPRTTLPTWEQLWLLERFAPIGWECLFLFDVLRSLGVRAYPWP